MPPLRIWVDLSDEESWHRREFEERMAASRPASEAVWASDASSADCVLTTTSPHHFGPGGLVFSAGPSSPDAHLPRFVWSGNDHPTGYAPGLYCSLPRALFDARRHRTFAYPFHYNERVQAFDPGEAHYLYGFVGGVTSGLRARLFRQLASAGHTGECLLRVQSGPWQQMFDRSGVAVKVEYAEALRRCRFFLCPRGNGVSSIRLFETMEAARVPVIVSDPYVLPSEIDWDTCAVRIRERDLASIPDVLLERAADWSRLAANARRVWETHFSDATLAQNLGRLLRPLIANSGAGIASRYSYFRRAIPFSIRVAGYRSIAHISRVAAARKTR